MFLSRSQVNYYIFILCCIFATACNAISMGDAKVYSFLDEPLAAEIELTNLGGLDPNLLIASLADAKDFARAGLERPYFLTSLNFAITTYQDRIFVFIRSDKVVQIPYLEFLIELSWPDGHMVKDYTLLIDPPPPNLDAATRPLSFSQLAINEAEKKSFGGDNIDQQLAEQELLQQDSKQVRITARNINKNQTSFGDEIVEQPAGPSSSTELVPSVVPDVEEIPAGPTEYEKQLAEFNQREQQKVQKQKQAASQNLMDRMVDTIEDLNADIKPQTNIKQLSEERSKYYSSDASVEEVDFNEVLPAKTNPTTAAPPDAAAFPRSIRPTIPTADATPPSTSTTSASGGRNYLYLAFILSLLLIAAAIAVVVKKGIYRKFMPHKNAMVDESYSAPMQAATVTPAIQQLNSTSTLDSLDADFAEEDLAEEIELSTANDAVAQNNVNNPEPMVQQSVTPAMSTVTPQATQQIPIPKTAESIVQGQTNSAFMQGFMPQNITSNAAAPAPEPSKEELDKFETELENIDLDQMAPTPVENPDNTANNSAAMQDILNFRMENTETTKTTEAIEGPTLAEGANLSTDMLKSTQEIPSEPAVLKISEQISNPVNDLKVIAESTDINIASDLQVDAETPTINPTSELKIAADAIVAAPGVSQVKPTSNPDQFLNSGLRLQEDGASLVKPEHKTPIIDNTEAINMKLKLAKQYLEAGDKESAREILREILEIAKDAQKVEAEILLSSIV